MATLATDAVALVASACAILLLAPAAARTSPAAVAAYPAMVLLLLALLGRYRPRWSRSLPGELRDSLATSAVGVIALSGACLLVGGETLTGVETLWLCVGGALSLVAGHLVLAVVLWRTRRRGTFTSPTLVVGAGRVGHLVARRLLERPELGLAPIGFLDKDPLAAADRATDLPVLGSSHELEDVVREHEVERVIIAFSTAPDELMLSVARRCGPSGSASRSCRGSSRSRARGPARCAFGASRSSSFPSTTRRASRCASSTPPIASPPVRYGLRCRRCWPASPRPSASPWDVRSSTARSGSVATGASSRC